MTGLKIATAALLLTTLCGCANGLGPQPESMGVPSAPVEKQAAMDSLKQCLIAAAMRLDDHQSDAATIATALHGACPKNWSAVYASLTEGETPTFKAMFPRQFEQAKPQITLNAVLAERRRASSN